MKLSLIIKNRDQAMVARYNAETLDGIPTLLIAVIRHNKDLQGSHLFQTWSSGLLFVFNGD